VFWFAVRKERATNEHELDTDTENPQISQIGTETIANVPKIPALLQSFLKAGEFSATKAMVKE
jgi:hypothetical protein